MRWKTNHQPPITNHQKMFKLFHLLKPMTILLIAVVILVAGQAVAELYLPEKMSEIIDDGIYLKYEPLYKHAKMPKPASLKGVEGKRQIKGYNPDEIPIFEMNEGFSTFDLALALEKIPFNHAYNVVFRDIPIGDSEELFEIVLTPFLDGLKPFQKVGADFNIDYAVNPSRGYTAEEKKKITEVINTLLVFDPNDPNTLSIDADKGLSVNMLLDQDPDAETMDNEGNRKILSACILSMKHSRHGNLAPIPLDKDGNRLATNEFGEPYERDKLLIIYHIDGDTEYYDPKYSKTGRAEPMPDYEVIICTDSLAYAYLYNGDKWVDNGIGITEASAQKEANLHNADLIKRRILYNRGFSDEKQANLSHSIDKIVVAYEDDLVILANILKASNYNLKRTEKLINKYESNKVTSWDRFWIKLGDYLKLSPTATKKEALKENELKTGKQMMLPDGETIQTQDFNYILTRGGLMLLLTIAACACAIIAALISAKIAANFSAMIRSKVFRKVETFSLNEFDKFSTASLITRSTNDISQIQSVFLLVLRTALIAPFTIIGGFALSFQKSVPMTVVIFYPFPILIVVSYIAAKVVFPLFQEIQIKVDRITQIMRESLTGIRVVRAFNQQERESLRFKEVNEKLKTLSVSVYRYVAVLAPLIAVVMNCTMVGIVWVASRQIAYGDDINVGDMMAVIQYITQIMMALIMLATVFVMFPRASASARRINAVLDTELSIKDTETPNVNYTERGTVSFENVNFKYSSEASENILSDISFKAERGKVTAIVGGTGSGKSSVINLIPRFYDILSGEIFINGVPIKEIPQAELRGKIGFVPQRSMLFSGTIKSNLQYGKEDATEEELWEALEIAQSAKFVKDKDGMLESRVEQGGNNFSGGQKQRLSIARAIIRKPEILIFDDSFSALDFRTDKLLRTALKKITKDSATIIVAQRVGTIMDADNILVLDEGKIVGHGTHKELLKTCPLYKDIALSQMSEEELGL
ncbi:MAG: ABC transporter ATP-binding protein [Firmicutes bacterium]|nr:ABC transporter ATP-binding protein [Bacillota bacterium]